MKKTAMVTKVLMAMKRGFDVNSDGVLGNAAGAFGNAEIGCKTVVTFILHSFLINKFTLH